jgi:hypothetical protein
MIGEERAAVCHPELVSPANVTLPRRVPELVHKLPVCVPLFSGVLKKRMLVTCPPATVVKRVPSSTAEVSESTAAELGASVPQIVSGVAAWAVDAVQMAAPVTDSATAVAMATPVLDPRSRSRGTKVI